VILHRLSQAMAKQDWFTVLLEIFIVVVGIFLGLQVDDWNESRKYRQEEAVYRAKLARDLVAMRGDLASKIEANEESIRHMTGALRALEACDDSDAARSELKYALEFYQVTRPFSYLDATYNEMVASGALARLADDDLKQEISYAYSRLGSINANQENFRISMPVVDEIVWGAVTYSVSPGSLRQEATFDLPAICNNTRLRNAVVEMIDIQFDSATGSRRALQHVDELIPKLTAQ